MADKDNPHFNKIYWYILMTTVLVLGYIAAVTFLNIPEANVRTVDTVTGFLLGTLLASGVGYLLGGNPTSKSKEPILPENSDTDINISTRKSEETTKVD